MTDRPAPDLREGSRFHRPDTWLLVVILFAFAIRLASIDFQSLWRDEVDAIRFGRDLTSQIDAALAGGGAGGVLGKLRDTLTRPGFNGPLYFLALEQWSRVMGDTGFALRFFSTCFGVLAIPLTTILAWRLFPTATAGFGTRINTDKHGLDVPTVRFRIRPGSRLPRLAGWLMAISPYFVWYAQEAKMYTEISALALAAIYALRRAVGMPAGQRAWPWWALTVGATTLAMYSHILAAMLIGVEAVLFLLWWPQSRRHWRGGLIALAALTLPYLPLAAWQIGLALTPGDQGHTFYSFDSILRVMATGFTYGVLPFDYALNALGIRWDASVANSLLNPSSWGVWVLGALVILGALMWKDAGDRANRIGLSAWAILPAAAIALVSLNRPVFTDRYLIWIGPAVYLLAALGIGEVWQWRRIAGGAALALTTGIMLLSVGTQAVTPFKSDFRSAARFVEERYAGEAMLFQIPYGQYTFDYYFQPPLRAIDGPYTNRRDAGGGYARDAASFDAEIAGTLSGQAAVWLVATEVELWDERRVLEDWLKRHARETDRGDFMRVSVVRYELNP